MKASLCNLESNDGTVVVCLEGEGAAAYAKNLQSFAGSRWESDGSDFAYCQPVDYPGLLETLEKQLGSKITIDTVEYLPPNPIE
jgi:hypothetical protein